MQVFLTAGFLVLFIGTLLHYGQPEIPVKNIDLQQSTIALVPLRENEKFAAELTGVKLETVSDSDFDIIHDGLLRYKVIVVRNQEDLSVEGLRRFTKRFGKLHVHLESSSHYPGYSDVNVVSNIKNSKGAYIGLFGKHVENFHSDLSWYVFR